MSVQRRWRLLTHQRTSRVLATTRWLRLPMPYRAGGICFCLGCGISRRHTNLRKRRWQHGPGSRLPSVCTPAVECVRSPLARICIIDDARANAIPDDTYAFTRTPSVVSVGTPHFCGMRWCGAARLWRAARTVCGAGAARACVCVVVVKLALLIVSWEFEIWF